MAARAASLLSSRTSLIRCPTLPVLNERQIHSRSYSSVSLIHLRKTGNPGTGMSSNSDSKTAHKLYLSPSPSSRTTARGAVAAAASSFDTSRTDMIRASDSYFQSDTRPIILFDGVCNLCNGGVGFVLDNDREGKLRMAALQSEAGRALLARCGRSPDDITSIVLVENDRKLRMAALQSEAGRALLARCGRSPDDITSIVLVENDRAYIKSEAVLRIAQHLQLPFPPLASLALLTPLFIRDTVYDTVADNRYALLGKRDTCRVSDERFKERFVA
eukprot:jgi/Mesen1/7099/ME000369S06420